MPHAISYVWSVSKHFDFAKSYLEHYGFSKKDIEKVFAGNVMFEKKYSKKPRSKLSLKDIEKETAEDAEELRDKINTKIRELDITERRINKVLGELPDGEDLKNIWLSYIIHGTEGRTRIRIPTKNSISNYNADTKKNDNKNNKV